MTTFIRPKDLPAAASVTGTADIPVDSGTAVEKATPAQIVDAGRPVSTEAQAIAGTNNDTAMTPLTTRQAIDSDTSGSVAKARAWAESGTEPGGPGTKSSKTWAEEAAESAKEAATFNPALFLAKDDNLAGLADVPTAQANLGLGSAAVEDSSAFATAAQGTKADDALPAADKADKPTAEAGTDNTKYMTPLRTADSIAANQAVKAWVNFNGTGTVAIRAALNVTSITDNGTGDYTVNFTTDIPDADYVAVGNAGLEGQPVSRTPFIHGKTVSSANVTTTNVSSGSGYDPDIVDVIFLR